MVDKGGCSIGRKKEPKGGCKEGKKKIDSTKPKFNIVKPTMTTKAPKKPKFNIVKKAPPKKAPRPKLRQLDLPHHTSWGGAYRTKHFIRKNKKTGALQYKKGSGSEETLKSEWINVNSKGITIDESKEHRGFGDHKDFRHYVIDKAPAKAKAEPTKVLTSVKLSGEGMDLPDLYKHGMGNASKAELSNMLDKMAKNINAEIKKMKTAPKDYFKVVKVRGGTEYHTAAASIMNDEQKKVQIALERYIKTHGIQDSGVQEMIGKFNKQARSAVNRMRKAKGTALERLGFI